MPAVAWRRRRCAEGDAAAREARARFEAGRALYVLGDYEEALREFMIGYQLVQKPEFLINLGQCYVKLRRPDKAREMYARFLATAPKNDPNRAAVEQLMAGLETTPLAPATPPTATTPAPPATTSTAPSPATPPAAIVAPPQRAPTIAAKPAKHHFDRRQLGWIVPLAGVVVAGAAVGIYFAVRPGDGCIGRARLHRLVASEPLSQGGECAPGRGKIIGSSRVVRGKRKAMNLKCPACGAPFSADDVHVDLGVANCRVCRGVLDLRAADRPLEMPTPPRFTVDESNGLTISWRWFRAKHVLALLFAIFWWAFLVVWYRQALRGNDTMAIVFPIFHVVAGLCLGYAALAGLFNRTRIGVDLAGVLTVAHGPLPWLTPRPVGREQLEQLYVQRVESRDRNGTTVSYTLSAIDNEGKRRKLVRDLPLDDARFLEWRLERQLNIRNRKVEGEATT